MFLLKTVFLSEPWPNQPLFVLKSVFPCFPCCFSNRVTHRVSVATFQRLAVAQVTFSRTSPAPRATGATSPTGMRSSVSRARPAADVLSWWFSWFYRQEQQEQFWDAIIFDVYKLILEMVLRFWVFGQWWFFFGSFLASYFLIGTYKMDLEILKKSRMDVWLETFGPGDFSILKHRRFGQLTAGMKREFNKSGETRRLQHRGHRDGHGPSIDMIDLCLLATWKTERNVCVTDFFNVFFGPLERFHWLNLSPDCCWSVSAKEEMADETVERSTPTPAARIRQLNFHRRPTRHPIGWDMMRRTKWTSDIQLAEETRSNTTEGPRIFLRREDLFWIELDTSEDGSAAQNDSTTKWWFAKLTRSQHDLGG